MAAKSYEKIRSTLQRDLAAADLADEGSHFPYHADRALDALRNPPEEGTQNHPEHWYISEEIIEANAAYVAAQQRYLEALAAGNDSAELKAAYEDTKRDVVTARQRHRAGRPAAPLAVAGAPQEIEERRSMVRQLAKGGWSAEAIANLSGRPVHEVQGALSGLED